MLESLKGQLKSDGEGQGSAQRFREMIGVLRRSEIVHGITPVKIRQILEELGPTFMKLGQIMSMRPDFLPQEYCDELVKLQANAKPMPFALVREIVEREYRCPWQKNFASIDEEALGSASIAQVHRAVLTTGEPVVIKVQRPGIFEVMSQDIVLLKRAAELFHAVSAARDVLDISMLLDEMWKVAKQEMDFLMEASHMDEFSQLNASEEYAACPKVYHRLTTSRILVMEYIDGIRFDDAEALAARNFDIDQLGRRLGENYVKQLVEDGYFHADPHPGNIRVVDRKIVWLDLGMMGRLSAHDRRGLRKAVFALVSHDTLEMKAAMLELGSPQGRVDHAKLYGDIDALMVQYGDLDFGAFRMGLLTRQIMSILREHRIGIGQGLCMFARGVLTIEGVMRRCCPRVSFAELFARSLQLNFKRDFDWRMELDRLKQDSYVFFRKTMRLPEQLSDILKMTMNGQTKVNLEVTGSQEPLRRIDGMINKLILGMISSALLLGSSVICMTQMTPKIMEIPLLGVFGYMAAVVLGGWVLWGILRNR